MSHKNVYITNDMSQTRTLKDVPGARRTTRNELKEAILLPLAWLNLQRCRLASHLFFGRVGNHYARKKRTLRQKLKHTLRHTLLCVNSWRIFRLRPHTSDEKHILLAFDDDQCWYVYVLLNSIFLNNTATHFIVHVIYRNMAETFETGLREWVREQGHGIRFYKFRDEDLAFCPTESSYVTPASYFRLWAAEYLPDEIAIVLYLDIDTLCVSDISHLFLPQINESACFATYGTAPPDRKLYLGLKPSDRYFQGGVLRLNLSAWRESGYIERMKKIIIEKKKFARWDQDVLNATLVPVGGIQYMPAKYNATDPFHSETCLISNHAIYTQFPFNDRKEAFLHPVIIHFTGFHRKPWFQNTGGEPLLCQLWLKYRKGTPAEEQELPVFTKKE